MTPVSPLTVWSAALHQSFRLLPPSDHLKAFFAAEDGSHWKDIYDALPFDAERSSSGAGAPDARRFRDPKQVYETAGLLYLEDDFVWFTDLGRTLKRFLPHLNRQNMVLLARHAALALAACQLRNPTDAGLKYAETMRVFPFRFIWQAMLELDLRISSDELNRAIFRVTDAPSLTEAIERIRQARRGGSLDDLGEETISDKRKDDRIIPWVSLASFGWTLLMDKKEGGLAGYYKVRDDCVRLLEAAIQTPAEHRVFESTGAYVQHVSRAACLPKDLR
jgi:hypothetical protein